MLISWRRQGGQVQEAAVTAQCRQHRVAHRDLPFLVAFPDGDEPPQAIGVAIEIAHLGNPARTRRQFRDAQIQRIKRRHDEQRALMLWQFLRHNFRRLNNIVPLQFRQAPDFAFALDALEIPAFLADHQQGIHFRVAFLNQELVETAGNRKNPRQRFGRQGIILWLGPLAPPMCCFSNRRHKRPPIRVRHPRTAFIQKARRLFEAYVAFCQNPPRSWTGIKKAPRFLDKGGTRVPNSDWRPFVATVAKAAHGRGQRPQLEDYALSPKALAGIFAITGSFYQFLIQEGYTEVNPLLMIRQKSRYFQRIQGKGKIRRLSELQWHYVIETAEIMAQESPQHE